MISDESYQVFFLAIRWVQRIVVGESFMHRPFGPTTGTPCESVRWSRASFEKTHRIS